MYIGYRSKNNEDNEFFEFLFLLLFLLDKAHLC